MTNIRLSPSGPEIKNSGGAPLAFGPGARLRLTEAVTTMGGSLAIPTTDPATAIISPDGFPAPDPEAALVLTLDSPKEALSYRAKLTIDFFSTSTNATGELVLYLDTSVDGGTTYTQRAANAHKVSRVVATDNPMARQAEVFLPLTLGSALGIDDDTPPASIKLRARAFAAAGSLFVDSVAAVTGASGLNGAIHLELEECF